MITGGCPWSGLRDMLILFLRRRSIMNSLPASTTNSIHRKFQVRIPTLHLPSLIVPAGSRACSFFCGFKACLIQPVCVQKILVQTLLLNRSLCGQNIWVCVHLDKFARHLNYLEFSKPFASNSDVWITYYYAYIIIISYYIPYELPIIVIQTVALSYIPFLCQGWILSQWCLHYASTMKKSCVCRSKENSDTCVQDDWDQTKCYWARTGSWWPMQAMPGRCGGF